LTIGTKSSDPSKVNNYGAGGNTILFPQPGYGLLTVSVAQGGAAWAVGTKAAFSLSSAEPPRLDMNRMTGLSGLFLRGHASSHKRVYPAPSASANLTHDPAPGEVRAWRGPRLPGRRGLNGLRSVRFAQEEGGRED